MFGNLQEAQNVWNIEGGMQRQWGRNLMYWEMTKKDCKPWEKLEFILRTKSDLKKLKEATNKSQFEFWKESTGVYAQAYGGRLRGRFQVCCHNLNKQTKIKIVD